MSTLHFVFLVLLALALSACAHSQPEPQHAQSSEYTGKCTLLGIEEVPSASDQATDVVWLVARYRFGEHAAHEPGAARDPDAPQLRFQIARERANDLRAHLQAHPVVLCEPEPAPTPESSYRIEVPPFQ